MGYIVYTMGSYAPKCNYHIKCMKCVGATQCCQRAEHIYYNWLHHICFGNIVIPYILQ